MERASARARPQPLEAGLLAAAIQAATRAVEGESDPAQAVNAAVTTLHEAVDGLYPAVLVLEHGHLWLVAQRGYASVPDGIRVDHGVVGRAIRQGRGQLVIDAHSDPDYVEVLPGVVSEATVPLRLDRVAVGALNIDSERPLPEETLKILRPLAVALAPLVEALRGSSRLDLSALARLFVYLGSLRDPNEIALLAAASFARMLRLDRSQVWMWDEAGRPVELATWRADTVERPAVTLEELEGARGLIDPADPYQLVELRPAETLIWLPLRANGNDFGALVGQGGQTESSEVLDAVAVLAAHTAASLDAALALRRERQSAVTDALTGILNRRGLEDCLEREITDAQDNRLPLSVLVLDCDDFKEVNDRAGHEFGDSLLREVADALVGSLPEGAKVGRMGGDEFVVMLVGAHTDAAKEHGELIRAVLAERLSDAGFPLRLSGGIATYPFDGATPTALLRAADQALYFAKDAGKNRVESFGDVVSGAASEPRSAAVAVGEERRAVPRRDAAVLEDVLAATRAIEAEETVEAVLERLCKVVVFTVGATAAAASQIEGDLLVDVARHSLREFSLGHEAAYRISDFPLTVETLETGEARSVSFVDKEVDPAEAFVLRDFGMNAMLMLPLRIDGRPWGLLEVYEMRMRRFGEDDLSLGEFLVAQAERRIAELAPTAESAERPPLYELPASDDEPGAARSR